MRRIQRSGLLERPASSFHLTHTLVSFLVLLTVLVPAQGSAVDSECKERFLNFNAMQRANPALVLDGKYVMTAGNLHMNITNSGFIGSHWSWNLPWSFAPSGQWPAGSGNEYLLAAGIWVGGSMLNVVSVSTGINVYQEIMARLDPEDTIYEAIGTKLVRPPGNIHASGRRFPDPNPNDDDDYDPDYPWVELIDEETLNGYDDDGDGSIDEDFAQISNQMMVCTMYDNTPLAMEWHPDHRPLNLKIVQESYAWENPLVQDFVGFDFTITNVGVLDIKDVYIGMYTNGGIANRSAGNIGLSDDMAGIFSGPVRASDGTWVNVEMGFMWDAAEEVRLDGYFGVVLLGHTTSLGGIMAPRHVKMHTFKHFSSQSPYQQGGAPTEDEERYEAMSDPEWDNDVIEGKEEDYSFLISVGPFKELKSDEELTFQVAFVAGEGLDGLKRNAAEALLTYYGSWFDMIPPQPSADGGPDVPIGVRGRETIVCQEDYSSAFEFRQVFPDFGDLSCMPSLAWLEANFQRVQDADIFRYARDGRFPDRQSLCIMVNMDNCHECYRMMDHQPGVQTQCSQQDFDSVWDCYRDGADPRTCTGVLGRESQVTWLVGMAPPPPGLRIWPTDHHVHLFWDNTSEITPDVRLNEIDFQSYRIWRADNWTRPHGTSFDTGPASHLWQLVAEFDVVDSFLTVHRISETQNDSVWLPLGRNTGLESIRYEPRILSEERFEGLADSMLVVADRDPSGLYNEQLPPLFIGPGQPNPITEPLLRWQGYHDALDTFWAVTTRPESTSVGPSGEETVVISAKEPVWYYEYVDPFVHNGFLYFYSVTATDHDMEQIPGTDPPQFMITGPGLVGDPSGSFQHTKPARFSQTAEDRARLGANIFVYPNPATRQALREFQQLYPSQDDPTGVRVNFANLPRAQNLISIYTVSGDLVQVIEHDGTQGYGEVSWNLISRNKQEIVSGIYLYTVQSSGGEFDDFIGKFVVVR